MAVAFDSSVLLLALYPSACAPVDPKTGKTLEYAKERVDFLVSTLTKNRTKVLIPTPVLSEVLVYAGSSASSLAAQLNQTPFRLAPFGPKAAFDCAEAIRLYGLKGHKGATRAKVKFDRQIVAIAKSEGVDTLYSDDDDVWKYGQHAGLTVVRSYELPRDPDSAQGKLQLDPKDDAPLTGASDAW
jgi:hypothetical protein